MLKKIVIVLALVLGLLVVVGLFLSQHYDVSRTITVRASKARIHALCDDLTVWDSWAPWATADKTMVTKLGDKTHGVGANQTWKGDSGEGRLVFTKSDPNEGIAYDMVFVQGEKEVPAKSEMRYTANGDAVDVTWRIEGEMGLPVVGGYLALFASSMIGPMFDTGLHGLKSRAEM
jgi:hypothetical protein